MMTHRQGPRTKLITIRVTPLEHDALIALAAEDGRSVGDLVRHRLLRPSTCVVSTLPPMEIKIPRRQIEKKYVNESNSESEKSENFDNFLATAKK